MTHYKEKRRNMKNLRRLAARLFRHRMLDVPRSEDERAIGLETRQMPLARALW